MLLVVVVHDVDVDCFCDAEHRARSLHRLTYSHLAGSKIAKSFLHHEDHGYDYGGEACRQD